MERLFEQPAVSLLGQAGSPMLAVAFAHKQVIAGYYDWGDGAKAATAELQAAQGGPGIQGLMYTTWADDYSQMAPFARAAKAGWSGYLNSLQ